MCGTFNDDEDNEETLGPCVSLLLLLCKYSVNTF